MAALYWFSHDFGIDEYQAMLPDDALTTHAKAVNSHGH